MEEEGKWMWMCLIFDLRLSPLKDDTLPYCIISTNVKGSEKEMEIMGTR